MTTRVAFRVGRGFAVCLLLLCSAGVRAGKVESHPVEGVDYSAFRTYVWGEVVEAPRPASQRTIVATVNEQMREAGYSEVSSPAEADLVLKVGVVAQMDAAQFNSFVSSGTYDVAFIRSDVAPVDYGSLLLTLLDARSGEVVWEAVGSGEQIDAAYFPERVQRKIRKLIRRMFRKLPG